MKTFEPLRAAIAIAAVAVMTNARPSAAQDAAPATPGVPASVSQSGGGHAPLDQNEDAKEKAEKLKTELLNLKAMDEEFAKTEGPNAGDRADILQRITALEYLFKQSERPGSEPREGLFKWNGGGPREFIDEASKQFHLPWSAIVSLPENVRIQVPPFTLYVRRADDILKMYNWLAGSSPGMGKWECQGNAEDPDALILTAPQVSHATKVRAFSLARISPLKWDALTEEIRRSHDLLVETADRMGWSGQTQDLSGPAVSINQDTKDLLVVGSQEEIDMVDSIVSAFLANPETRAQPQALQNAAPPTPGTGTSGSAP